MFYFDLAYFWNKPNSLRFDHFKFLKKQTLICFDLSIVWNRQSLLRFCAANFLSFAQLAKRKV